MSSENIYVTTIRYLSIENKFLKWYINIIEKAKSRASSKKQAKKIIGYSELHHIVPESFYKNRKRKGTFGFLDGTPSHIDNLVYLTPKEHIICHIFLTKFLIHEEGRRKMIYAVNRMLNSINGKYKLTPNTYSSLKKQISENHVSKREEIKNKKKQTNFKNRGVFHNFSDVRIIENKKQTYLNNYGVDNPSKSEEIKNTKKQTYLNNYGVDNPSKSEEIKNTKKQTFLENYGVCWGLQSDEIKIKGINTCIEKYGVTHYSKRIVSCEYCGQFLSIWHQRFCEKNPNKLKNPSAKIFILKSPENNFIEVDGQIEKFCKSQGFTWQTLKRKKNYKGWEFISEKNEKG